MKKVFYLLLAIVLVFSLAACGGNDGDKEVKATKITVSARTSRVQIEHTLQLSYSLTPANATDVEKVAWSVNNASLGSISDQGLFTASTTADVVRITATATKKDGTTISGSKSIQITEEAVVEYPDLGGYTISIAQADYAMGEIDVFLEEATKDKYRYYSGSDRLQRQQAWRDVEEAFNCTIEVRAYPEDAAWGGPRWNYILNQARLDSPQYDLYVVPDAQIPGFVSGNAIVDLTEWYDAYGENSMTAMSKQAGSYKGHLYSINTSELNVYNILCYNVGLWEAVHGQDETIEEPAAIFNAGNWNVTTFVEYCTKVQNALISLYGADSGYYCLSGWPTYYFVGMVDRNGVGVADVANMKMHLAGDDETEVGDALKTIFANGAFDPDFSVDQNVTSWNDGKALFNTGDFWFVGANNRYTPELWGTPEETKYGFVPFPSPSSVSNETYFTGLTAEACWVMAAGRAKAYESYGPECTTENVYRAIMTYLNLAKKYYTEDPAYDPQAEFQRRALTFASEASQKAFLTISYNLEAYGFYDPLTSNSNTVVYTYGSAWDIAIRNYVKGTGASSWAEAVGGFQETLDESILKAFG